VLSLPELESLVQVGLELLLESVHLVLLLLDELGLSRDDLLVSVLHVLLALVDLHLLASHLDLVGFGILGLLCETGLDSLLVEELSAELESKWQLLLQLLSVFLKLLGVSVFELPKSLGIFLLSLEEVLVPLLVELLVLLDVSLFALLALLSLVKNQLFISSVVVLESQLGDAVLRHLGLHVLALLLASLSVLLQSFDEILDVVGVGLLVEGLVLVGALVLHGE